jgi:pimeloyl-ACP methyl ester carboxylesterase
VLVQLGTPNSRILYPAWLRDARERAIRLISYDRPGYGGSTARPGRTVADCVAVVRAILDALRVERLAVWGISGGGPHALACASLLGDRVVAAAALASTAPMDADGLDWLAGTSAENVEGVDLMLNDPLAAHARLETLRREILSESASDLLGLNPGLFSPVDAAALTAELVEYYARRDRDGLAPGVEGWWEDSVALLGPWGFALETIQTPVLVWHGRHDHVVPLQHGQWLAEHLSNATARFTDDDGHLTLLASRVPAVHAWAARALLTTPPTRDRESCRLPAASPTPPAELADATMSNSVVSSRSTALSAAATLFRLPRCSSAVPG